jgi:hypothetical protein
MGYHLLGLDGILLSRDSALLGSEFNWQNLQQRDSSKFFTPLSISSMRMRVEDVLIQEDLDPKRWLNCKLSERTAKAIGYHIIQDWSVSSPDLRIHWSRSVVS